MTESCGDHRGGPLDENTRLAIALLNGLVSNASEALNQVLSLLAVVLVASAGLGALSASGFAQSAVRDDLPNGKLRGQLYEYFTREQWEASNFATPEAMKAWQDRRYGMFIHFGITSKAEKDLSWGSIGQR